ncbi:putative mfs transporter protein [Phaeoacremonium minimum UCRPA7]|uniref:Putative mfs transporter protein n=1 Tax=Phaeoacremonium minimum (strain UCR-PA7) TaxID=1286976 RepID=R8BY33_PHAM7|nr:putative mfs transporter protein [Phaeoacremonium minimum UCRPA7]EOO04194.1 putative mfs transporter protein [Phaeoacremonium minimum UCRPA7]
MDENLDEKAIHEIEEVLGTKIYPGTEIMKDVGTHHFVKSHHKSVLIPQPSDDPQDPLNWSPFWKIATIFSSTALSFSLNLGPLALAPMFEAYIEEWGRSLADVVQFTGVAILVLGFSNFIWVPMSQTGVDAEAGNSDKLAPTETHVDPALGKGKPGKKQFLPVQGYEGNLFRELWLPFYLHLYPIVEFAAFVVSWSASGFLVVNLSQTQAFAAPPYDYKSQTIGLFNIAVLIGGLIGLFTCGPLSDWVAAHLTARNNGVREPEMRLLAMIPYVIIMIFGSIITAVGYDHHWPWQAIVVLGYASLGMQVSALPSIASTYAIDSYKPITGSMFVTITINKNVWGYGVSKFITPWAEKNGFIPPILVNMALTTIFCLCGIIFWFYGKRFRGITKDSFVHRL